MFPSIQEMNLSQICQDQVCLDVSEGEEEE